MLRQSCRGLVPVLTSSSRKLQLPQPQNVRNVWDIARPSDFRSMMREMDRQMERFEREIFDRFPLRKLVPRTIPVEGNEAVPYRINIDVAGFKPEEINVAVKDKILTIRAKMERVGDDGGKFHQEVSREMTLPDNVQITELKSFLNPNGVLTVEAPIQPNEKPQEIPVTGDVQMKSQGSN